MKRIRFFCLLLILALTVLPILSSCRDESDTGNQPPDTEQGGENPDTDNDPSPDGGNPTPDDGGGQTPDDGGNEGNDPPPDDGGNDPDGGEPTPPPTGGDNEEGVEGLVPQLATPAPFINYKQQAVEWEAVPNATGYIVTVNGEARPVQTETSLSLPDGFHTVTVQAVGAQGYLDSPPSEPLKVNFGWIDF